MHAPTTVLIGNINESRTPQASLYSFSAVQRQNGHLLSGLHGGDSLLLYHQVNVDDCWHVLCRAEVIKGKRLGRGRRHTLKNAGCR